MALPKQLDKCVIEFGTGTNVAYEFVLQDSDISIQAEYFGGGAFDEAIGGKRISNLRAFRVNVDMSYQAAREDGVLKRTSNTGGAGSSSNYASMFNETITHFVTNQKESARLYFGKSLSQLGALPNASANYVTVVPTDMTYQQVYSSQVGRFVPRLSFTSQDLITSIPEHLKGVL